MSQKNDKVDVLITVDRFAEVETPGGPVRVDRTRYQGWAGPYLFEYGEKQSLRDKYAHVPKKHTKRGAKRCLDLAEARRDDLYAGRHPGSPDEEPKDLTVMVGRAFDRAERAAAAKRGAGVRPGMAAVGGHSAEERKRKTRSRRKARRPQATR